MFNLKNQYLIWGKCFFNTEDASSNNCSKPIKSMGIFMGFAIICVILKKYSINIPCAFQSRVIHAKMTFRILHSQLTEYLSRTPLGVILNRFSNDIDDIDNYIGPILDNGFYYLFKTGTDIYGIL